MTEGKRSKKVLFASVAVLAVLLIVSLVAILVVATKVAPVPKDIEKQLTFSPFIVAKSETRDIKMSDFTFDSSNKVLRYNVRLSESAQFSINEQQSPPNFTEIPELFKKTVDQLNPYATIETFNGTTHLTKPSQVGQTAVMNEKGVFILIQSKSDQSDETWKRLVESFDIYRIR